MTPISRLVVDASVALKWYLAESDSEAARALIASEYDLIAPNLLPPELANALWANVRKGKILPDHAREAFAVFMTTQPVTLHDSSGLVTAALEIGIALVHSVYDCLYLALARAEQCRLVTTDQGLIDATQGSPYQALVQHLATV